jgi:L-idonate 5-dehydrogenase
MTSMTFAATLFGPEDLRMVERPLDPLAAGMVRIRFGAGGICGSDMHYYRHARTGDFVVTSPLVLGHEIAGEVIEIAGTAPGLKTGDRVAVNPSRWCGRCKPCGEGRPNLCENIFFMGSASKTPHMQGGFASMFDAIPAQCVKIPDHVSYQAAALAEPLAVCLHAVARAGDVSGKNAVLFGWRSPAGSAPIMSSISPAAMTPSRRTPRRIPSMWPLRSRERRRALPVPSVPSGAAASWCRSAICRAGRSRFRRTR